MTTTIGLTNKDWKVFKDLIIKANNEQIYTMLKIISNESQRMGEGGLI